jgi:two-component system LytT family response regulator
LQKPVSRSRLAKAVARGRQQLELREAARAAARSDKGALAATEGTTADPYVTRFAVRRGGVARFVRSDEVDWIDSAGNYVRLHVRGTTYMLRCTIGGIEARLDPRHFARIHRSAIVNLDRVAKLERFAHGEHVVVVSDGTRLRSSRAHSARLRTFLRSGIA